MKVLYMDTSALVKRYHEEDGTDIVNLILDDAPSGSVGVAVSSLVVPETVSTLNRRRNEGGIDNHAFESIISAFYEELKLFRIHSVDDRMTSSSIPYMLKHNLNSADAIHLTVAAAAARRQDKRDEFRFVCCDKRLLAAARKERLKTINPEIASVADVERTLSQE